MPHVPLNVVARMDSIQQTIGTLAGSSSSITETVHRQGVQLNSIAQKVNSMEAQRHAIQFDSTIVAAIIGLTGTIIVVIVAIWSVIRSNRENRKQHMRAEQEREYRHDIALSNEGIALFESFREEVSTGIEIIEKQLVMAHDPAIMAPPQQISAFPTMSWESVDSVPLNIVALINKYHDTCYQQTSMLELRRCRIDIKNYFAHITKNITLHIQEAVSSYSPLVPVAWKTVLIDRLELGKATQNTLETVKQIRLMLDDGIACYGRIIQLNERKLSSLV